MQKVVIVDCGLGNFTSVYNMSKKIGCTSIISDDVSEIEKADKLIIPGVGSFDTGMKRLRSLGFIDVLNKKALEEKIPVLGICMGMQFMGNGSEEGSEAGLSWVDIDYRKFDFSNSAEKLKVPHMGWNFLLPKKESKLLQNDFEHLRFYFVHSYHAVTQEDSLILGTTQYGYEFVSAFEQDNLLGIQFHPEKSHKYGMLLLNNFINNF